MHNVFDLESRIQECWAVVDDIKLVYHCENLYEDDDEMMNALLGLFTLYEIKFNNLWSEYEKLPPKYFGMEEELNKLKSEFNNIKGLSLISSEKEEMKQFEKHIIETSKSISLKKENNEYKDEKVKFAWKMWLESAKVREKLLIEKLEKNMFFSK